MKRNANKTFSALIAAAISFVAVICAFFGLFSTPSVEAGAESAVIRIEKYEAEVEFRADRKVEFYERITVRFLSDRRMFFRSLPVDGGDRYFGLWAKCEGNSAFRFDVKDNPDEDGYIDINCYGGTEYGNVWTYEFGYTMLPPSGGELDISLDVVGFGWTVPVEDVDVLVSFPDRANEVKVYSASYGENGNRYAEWAYGENNQSVSVHADRLPAEVGITLAVDFATGVLKSASSTQVTGSVWAVVLSGIAVVCATVLFVVFFRKPKEIVTTVSVKPPRGLDPLRMGKLIDGSAEDGDVTAMIYWFASQGYLTIDLTDEDDPLLTRTKKALPEDAPAHQRILLNGLFKSGDEVRPSELKEKYYQSSDRAKGVVSAKSVPRYERSSTLAAFGGAILAAIFAAFVPAFIGLAVVGGGYFHLHTGGFLAPCFIVALILLRVRNDRKFKAKNGFGWTLAVLLIALVSTVLYAFVFYVHMISTLERVLVCAFGWVCVFLAGGIFSHTQAYADILGEILGFKDFIVHTEEDRIEFMLKENPELYYDILPYAQVLGVTKEWEEKFRALTLEPPSWASGEFTFFDYMVLRSCMRTLTLSLSARPQAKGSSVGGFGGGGGFGGFAGGGHGGGGGGAR